MSYPKFKKVKLGKEDIAKGTINAKGDKIFCDLHQWVPLKEYKSRSQKNMGRTYYGCDPSLHDKSQYWLCWVDDEENSNNESVANENPKSSNWKVLQDPKVKEERFDRMEEALSRIEAKCDLLLSKLNDRDDIAITATG